MQPACFLRRFILLVAIVLALSAIAITPPIVRTAYALSEGDYTYSVADGKATVTGYTGAGGEVVIPPALGGYPVTVIGDNAFSENESITSVVIPNGVVDIGWQAFYYCQGITDVIIPESLTRIGDEAFNTCYRLDSIVIPKNVVDIGDHTFSNCYYLTWIYVDEANAYYSSADGVLFNENKTILIRYPGRNAREEYSIPASVKEIREDAFWCAGYLKRITIPDGVQTIGDRAFFDCNHLLEINLPASITSMGDGLFEFCTGLVNINVASANPSYSSVDGVLFNKEKSILIKYPGSNLREIYAVPDGVTNILDHAFECSYYLKTLNIPVSVTAIGEDYAFNWTIALQEINVDAGNPSYSSQDGVLYNKPMTTMIIYPKDNPRTSYRIPEGVADIGDAFDNCHYLERISIPSSITTIEDHAFALCYRLINILIPNSITSIGDSAFAGCSALGFVIIPESITDINKSAFSECTKLSAAYFKGNAPILGSEVFDESTPGFTVYYSAGASGYSDPWYGYHTEAYDPEAQLLAPALSFDRARSLLKGVPLGRSANEIRSLFLNSVDDIRLLDKNGSEYTGSTVATGMSVQLNVGGTAKDTLKVCVAGDISGDGKITVADYTLVRLHLLGLKSQAGAYLAASDINRDGGISISDYTDIRLDILGIKKIH